MPFCFVILLLSINHSSLNHLIHLSIFILYFSSILIFFVRYKSLFIIIY
nr:MAG TPA: hypothetical protein [Bacteriophage sp.]